MKYSPVSLTKVSIEDAFWAPRIKAVREVTIPQQWEALNDRVPGAAKSGAVMNFKVAAKQVAGEHWGPPFQDSDLAKWIEATGHSLATHPDPKLEAIVDELIDTIAAAQEPDGYMVTAFIIKDRDKRWTNLAHWHEMYDIGHMTEAAVAYYQATGKRKLLDVVMRAADNLAAVFGRGEGQKRGYCGHEEIELALVKLYRATGEKKYLDLAKYFVDERGQKPYYFQLENDARGDAKKWSMRELEYFQTHMPVREQKKATGHCVRAMYLYCAMTDLAAETGDKGLLAACKRLWADVTKHKLYVTGGIGSSGSAGEAFTMDYELPNETAYTETCAAIGLMFWAHRMLGMELRGEYADVMERALYNGILSGISLDGTRYFYCNPLASVPGSEVEGARSNVRIPWHGCSCCPPNILRLFASLGGYVYSQTAKELFVHLYIGGKAEVEVGGQKVGIVQETAYPWGETVRLAVNPAAAAKFTLGLRIPGWCRGAKIKVNGKPVKADAKDGYARISREWQAGDVVELTLPMPVERMYAHPSVRHDVGRVALQRGPVVYCLEEADNGNDLNAIALPRKSKLAAKASKLFGGVPMIVGKAVRAVTKTGEMFGTDAPKTAPAEIKAVPYFLWSNRKSGEMVVWVREAL